LDSHKCSGVALVGFCWGGWGTCTIVAHFPERVKCQAIAHPSIHAVEGLHGRNPADLCKQVHCPTFLLPGGNDPESYRTGGDCMKALKENNSASKSSDHEFDAVNHGWVPRADCKESELVYVTKAVDMMGAYIKEHLFK